MAQAVFIQPSIIRQLHLLNQARRLEAKQLARFSTPHPNVADACRNRSQVEADLISLIYDLYGVTEEGGQGQS
jgi:hypothetical protein